MTDFQNLLDGRQVRLFSAVSITGAKEAEMRATSALLSTVKAVSEFGRFFTKAVKGPAGRIECYTEVKLENKQKSRQARPDGVLRVVRGKNEWNALVEVKVGSNGLDQSQFDDYQNLAKEYGFDALITISNQPALPNGHPPLKIDLRKAKSIPVTHLSWERLLNEAQLLSWQGSVADEDHQYILNEWIRYINDPNAKIVVAPRVGPYWDELLSSASGERLSSVKQSVEDFVFCWCGFMRIQAFRLRALLGQNVELRIKREEKKKAELLVKRLSTECVREGKVFSSLIIPFTAGDLDITFDLRARKIFFEVQLTPPPDKTTKGQISWVVNQLKRLDLSMPDLNLIVDWKKRGLISLIPVSEVEQRREELMFDMAKQAIPSTCEISAFRVQWKTKLSRKKTEVFTSIGRDAEIFYKELVQKLKAYQPPAPKIKKVPHQEKLDPFEEAKSRLKEALPAPLSLPTWEDQSK